MLDTSQDLVVCEEELGSPVGQLLTPLTRFRRKSPEFAVDNGAFSRFNSEAFISLLRREDGARRSCRFVAVPDVVGSARRTLEVFEHWSPRLSGWPLALVAQDGLEDLPIPWKQMKAVFIGGSTEWKESSEARAVIKAAQALGKWVHVGRVNTPERWEYCEKLGVDSVDGSGISRYSWMRTRIRDRYKSPQLSLDLSDGERAEAAAEVS